MKKHNPIHSLNKLKGADGVFYAYKSLNNVVLGVIRLDPLILLYFICKSNIYNIIGLNVLKRTTIFSSKREKFAS